MTGDVAYAAGFMIGGAIVCVATVLVAVWWLFKTAKNARFR